MFPYFLIVLLFNHSTNAYYCDFIYGQTCYLTSRHEFNWLDAIKFCRSIPNGKLAEILHKNQSVALTSWLSYGNHRDFWIGMNDFKQHGHFECVQYWKIGFTNWAYGYPVSRSNLCYQLKICPLFRMMISIFRVC